MNRELLIQFAELAHEYADKTHRQRLLTGDLPYLRSVYRSLREETILPGSLTGGKAMLTLYRPKDLLYWREIQEDALRQTTREICSLCIRRHELEQKMEALTAPNTRQNALSI